MKIIYDQDYVVAESSNMIEYKIQADSFAFKTSDIHDDQSYLRLQDDYLLDKKLSFTVELIGRNSENWPKEVCYENSSEKFREWITRCTGKAIIREPTPAELAQVQQYREQQKSKRLLGILLIWLNLLRRKIAKIGPISPQKRRSLSK